MFILIWLEGKSSGYTPKKRGDYLGLFVVGLNACICFTRGKLFSWLHPPLSRIWRGGIGNHYCIMAFLRFCKNQKALGLALSAACAPIT
jgi:hypothetical protein